MCASYPSGNIFQADIRRTNSQNDLGLRVRRGFSVSAQMQLEASLKETDRVPYGE